MQEVSTCSYQLHIATQQLCSHPGLNRAPSQTTKITCLQQEAHHDHAAEEGPRLDIRSQAQDSLHEVELSPDHVSDGHLSSSHAQSAHETMLADLKVAGQLEAFESAVRSQADNEDDDEDL